MEIGQHWSTIRRVVNQALKRNGYCAVATVNPDGSPRVTPIGSLFLVKPGKGFYFEEFPKQMRRNLDENGRICILAMIGGRWYWLKALFRGRMDSPPGVRLIGRASARRLATEEEMDLWRDRVKAYRRLKGYQMLWKDMHHVREITFERFEPLELGAMGRGLWGTGAQ